MKLLNILSLQGANKDAKDIYGWTPLFFAVKNSHLDVVKYLIYSGANKHARSNSGVSIIKYTSDKNVRDFLNSIGVE